MMGKVSGDGVVGPRVLGGEVGRMFVGLLRRQVDLYVGKLGICGEKQV